MEPGKKKRGRPKKTKDEIHIEIDKIINKTLGRPKKIKDGCQVETVKTVETDKIIKKKRGRPKKIKDKIQVKTVETDKIIKKTRGRPKKIKEVEQITSVEKKENTDIVFIPKRSLRIEINKIKKEMEKIEKEITNRNLYDEKRERKSRRLQTINRKEENCSVCLCGTVYLTECNHYLCKKCYLEIFKYNKILYNRNPPCPICRKEIKEPL